MATTTRYTIILRSNNPDNMMQRVREGTVAASQTIKPGHLLAYTTSGTLKVHDVDGGNTQGTKVALENPWNGDTTVSAIEATYSASDWIPYIFAQPGDQLYMLLAVGENVAIGDALTSNGDGTLRAFTVPRIDGTGGSSGDYIYPEPVVGYAAEAVDNSGGSAAVRIRVDIA